MKITEHVPLKSLSTFRTGGPARFLLLVETKEELAEARAFAREKNLPVIPWGRGSNMLPPDSGLNAVVITYRPSEMKTEETERGVRLTAEAGAVWDEVVARAAIEGLWGLENLSAIPGTVGAAVVQNIGAYGAALQDSLEKVEAYDFEAGEFRTFSRDECDFGYRTSVFKKNPDRYFITEVSFLLSKTGEPNLSYRDLTVYFEKKPISQTLANVRRAVMEIRESKFPPLAEYGTAGSFFLNPIFTPESVKRITEKYPEMPTYPLPEGGVKVPLAWIFDQVLKAKGRKVGGAFIWHKQPLVIAANEGASSADVAELARGVVKDFLHETGITIVPEVRLFSEDKKKFE
jgi:UDP-N-acetylmuramate dehydrogenase